MEILCHLIIRYSFELHHSDFVILFLRFGARLSFEYANYGRTFLNCNATSRSIRHSKLPAGLRLLHRWIHLDLAHFRRQR